MNDEEIIALQREVWSRKPLLREAYARYHQMLLERCSPRDAVLELGCGMGHLSKKALARGYARWVATDLLPVEDAHVVCDGLALPFRTASFDRVVFIDVLHHLASPKVFFREAARVLRPGSAVVCIEPWVTPFSYPIYRWIHREGCDLSRDVETPFASAGVKHAYHGDNGIVSVLCRRTRAAEWARLGFNPPVVRPFNDFAYLTTRGLTSAPEAPSPVFSTARLALDAFLSPLAPLLGMRALIRWKRRGR